MIEVSHTTARYDLGKKRLIYARAEIPEYWVFDILKAKIHRFWTPENGDYSNRNHIDVPGRLASVHTPDLTIDTDGLI